MKIGYTLILTFLLVLSSCVNDYNDGKDNRMTNTHDYDTESTLGSEVSVDQELEKEIRERDIPDRSKWQKTGQVLLRLGSLKGKTVADIGAGNGFFTIHLLEGAEKVIATDVDPVAIQGLEDLKQRLKDDIKSKLETRLVPFDNPGLQPDEVDIVFMSNIYSVIENKVDYLKASHNVLKSGGRVCIVDYKMKKLPPIGPPQSERVPLFEAERHLEAAGFRHVFSDDQTLDYQYIVIGEKL